MSTYVPAVPTALPQPVRMLRPGASAARRKPAAASGSGPKPAPPSHEEREAQRREIERADRQRAQAEQARDNMAAWNPLSLR